MALPFTACYMNKAMVELRADRFNYHASSRQTGPAQPELDLGDTPRRKRSGVGRRILQFFLGLTAVGLLGVLIGVIGVALIIHRYAQDLPDYRQLLDYKPPVVTRIHAADGRLVEEYARERRVFVPIDSVPSLVIDAFLAAEDKTFYSHHGLDYTGIARAVIINVRNLGREKRPVGASTITQQVAKNFLLNNEVSIERKIKEAILAFRLERVLSKDRLLELYLNEIYLGQGSYGIAAASLNYFNKNLEELTIAEAAYLGALPKAPNNYHPVRDHEAALNRRNWVISQMVENGMIHPSQGELARNAPLRMRERQAGGLVRAPYFAEEIRKSLEQKFGEDGLYGGGLSVRTTLNPRLQDIAEDVLRDGLEAYDRRHGYRGPLAHIGAESFQKGGGWRAALNRLDPPAGTRAGWKLAVVLETGAEEALIGLKDGQQGRIMAAHLKWAREILDEGYGPSIQKASDALDPGDVILVEDLGRETSEGALAQYGLRQIPRVEGALVALDPHTGRILAMQGGYTYARSSFNRVSQAKRQPGSAFKPFVYLAALEQGFTPATLILDAPFVTEQGPGLSKWRPSNYSGNYYGPTPLRVGLEKSRNLMTVRLADYIGMEKISDYAKTFGIADSMPPLLAMALGARETTLMDLTSAYGMLVSGGRRIEPHMIERIQNRRGETILRHDRRDCEGCGPLVRWAGQSVPVLPETREQVADPRIAYQVVDMLQGVVQRGTASRLKELNRPVAGKTGTTNDFKDAWFIGFTPDMVVGVYVGFDNPESLGRHETGGRVSAPIFKAFVERALENEPPVPFRVPKGIRHARINAETGARARPGDEKVIWEAFLAGSEPDDNVYILDGKGISLLPTVSGNIGNAATTGTGGLY